MWLFLHWLLQEANVTTDCTTACAQFSAWNMIFLDISCSLMCFLNSKRCSVSVIISSEPLWTLLWVCSSVLFLICCSVSSPAGWLNFHNFFRRKSKFSALQMHLAINLDLLSESNLLAGFSTVTHIITQHVKILTLRNEMLALKVCACVKAIINTGSSVTWVYHQILAVICGFLPAQLVPVQLIRGC